MGVDREPRWVAEAGQHFRRAFPHVPPDLLTFVQGDATGILLPGCYAQVGLADIAVHQSDRVPARFPPYQTPPQQALLEQERRFMNSAFGPWDCEEVRRQVLAGGGTGEFFERVFAELIEKFAHEQEAIAAGTFHAAYGVVNYLVSGRKP